MVLGMTIKYSVLRINDRIHHNGKTGLCLNSKFHSPLSVDCSIQYVLSPISVLVTVTFYFYLVALLVP